MLTLAGKEQQLGVPSPHDVLSQADHAQRSPVALQCQSAALKCKSSQHTGQCIPMLMDTHSLRKPFTVL